VLAAFLCAGAARADEPPATDEALFAKGGAALAAGEYGAAIDALEALADRGFFHPDASYDRGLAYLMRIRARGERPGDLGRAAAAFEETLRLAPEDREAEAALDLVRAEVTRRRARKGGSGIDARPTLDRVIVGLASDRTWAIASIVASVLLAAGILLRRFDRPERAASLEDKAAELQPAQRPAHPLHVAVTVVVAVSIVALLALVPIAWHARTLRLTTRPGVVVATEAHFTDDTGRALGGDAIPEAAAVEVGERRGSIVHVRWGAAEGWLPATSVRVLP
jgi:tetratricopeptide (TPR) repeat protein